MFCILKSRFRQRPMQIVCQSCQHTTTDVAQVHAHRSHIHRPYGPNICHVMPPHVTALAITFCEMAHFGVRFGPFRTAKRPISRAKTAHFVLRNGPFCNSLMHKCLHRHKNTACFSLPSCHFALTLHCGKPPHVVMPRVPQATATEPPHAPSGKHPRHGTTLNSFLYFCTTKATRTAPHPTPRRATIKNP